MKIQLLMTGNELMAGHTVDSNSSMIALALGEYDFKVHRKVVVGDDPALLRAEIDSLSTSSDVLIINGGLGPTVDDLTAAILADVLQAPLHYNDDAIEHLLQWCARLGFSLNNANRKQALLPEGINILPNPVGSAVGFYAQRDNCLIICTPGVPRELQSMLHDSVIPLLLQRFTRPETPQTTRIKTFGIGESTIQEWVNNEIADWPDEVALGFRAGSSLLELKLAIHHTAHEPLRQSCLQKLKNLIGDYIVGYDDASLPEVVLSLLQRRDATLSTAESCTGGQIAALLTGIAGASRSFNGGWVTYTNEMKMNQLGVAADVLIEYGAVSEAVVEQMAIGAIERSKSDYSIAVSGIAGPDGGSDEKPVGTVALAWGNTDDLRTATLVYPSGRRRFQSFIALVALDLLRRHLSSIDTQPRYFERELKAQRRSV